MKQTVLEALHFVGDFFLHFPVISLFTVILLWYKSVLLATNVHAYILQ